MGSPRRFCRSDHDSFALRLERDLKNAAPFPTNSAAPMAPTRACNNEIPPSMSRTYQFRRPLPEVTTQRIA